MENAFELIDRTIHDGKVSQVILSKTRKKDEKSFNKVVIKPVIIRDELVYQFTYHYTKKVTHTNFGMQETIEACNELIKDYFRQVNLYTTEADYQMMISKKGKVHVTQKPPTKKKIDITHNRTKNYILSENIPYDFLIKLGVMNKQGKVLAQKYDKFKQLNRYLEMVADCTQHLQKDRTINIIDFGCGKSYLTFALYYYLVERLGLDVQIVGLDLKEEVIAFCNKMAKELHYEKLTFIHGDIKGFEGMEKVDMVVTLHACDTATDAALAKAVGWDADVILSVPCCQHELLGQIHNPVMKTMEKHGIIKEKLSSLITDSMRGNILEIMGYSVQMLEFIDMEHTPKNILIRAFKKGAYNKEAVMEYKKFKEFWHIEPYIEKDMGEELARRLQSN